MLRYLKTKQSLNGFSPSAKRGNFFDYYGSDGRARPWLNPYGSQSARYQPKATGFIPLKAAWMRSLIQPPAGRSIVGIDYGSEEFLIAAILSGDKNMYESYASGDPYLALGKLAKAIPEEGTKEEYPELRLMFKATTLGISYLMASNGLARKVTQDTGKETSPDEAQKLIDTFFNAYPDYQAWIERTTYEYSRRGFLKLPDGWVMFGENPNHRSVANCPIQGMGGCILRKAIELAQERGVRIIIPLHDALYGEFFNFDTGAVRKLYDSMREAFSFYFKGDEEKYEWSKAIRMDIDVWGPGRPEGYFETKSGLRYKSQTIYIDPRSLNEYERFQKYF